MKVIKLIWNLFFWCLYVFAILFFGKFVFDAVFDQTPSPEKRMSISLSNIERGGFGTVIIADVNIHNGNSKTVSDVKFTCYGYSKTGTKIDSNTRTIYEYVDSFGYKTINKFNLGYVHSDVNRFECKADSVK